MPQHWATHNHGANPDLSTRPQPSRLQIGGVNGIVHVTGGGLIENPPRVYDDDLALKISIVRPQPLPAGIFSLVA